MTAKHVRIAAGLTLVGGASFVFRFTAPSGRRREMGLGAYEPSAAERCTARAVAAAQDARDLLSKGIDPIDQRAQARASAKVAALRSRGLTLRRLLRRYHAACVEPLVSDKYARQWTFRVENDAPAWLLDKPMVDLSSDEILTAIREADVTQMRRDLLRQRIDQACEWLIRSGTVEANPAGVRRNTRRQWQARFDGEPA